MTNSTPEPGLEDLAHLQLILLGAVLGVRPLPGHDQPVTFPDLGFLEGQSEIIVDCANLAGGLEIAGLDRPLRIVEPDELRRLASDRGDLPHFRFERPEVDGDSARLVLELRMAPADPVRRPLGLSGIQVTFVRKHNRWQAEGEPAYFAM